MDVNVNRDITKRYKENVFMAFPFRKRGGCFWVQNIVSVSDQPNAERSNKRCSEPKKFGRYKISSSLKEGAPSARHLIEYTVFGSKRRPHHEIGENSLKD